MALLDMDPVFIRAIKLLHSKSKDSAAQLRQMVDDSIACRKIMIYNCDSKPSAGSYFKQDDVMRKTCGKRKLTKNYCSVETLDSKKVKMDVAVLQRDVKNEDKFRGDKQLKQENKKVACFLKNEKQGMLEREGEVSCLKEEAVEWDESTEEEEVSDGSENMSMAVDDFAVDLGIVCTVCMSFEVSPGNQLIECQECHILYHQECHVPPVTDLDVNDPRFVWYCSKCTKTIKQQAEKSQKPSKSKPPTQCSPNLKVSKSDVPISMMPFKRVDAKPFSGQPKEPVNTPSSSSQLRGLASFAANLTKPDDLKSESKLLLQSTWGGEIGRCKDPTDKQQPAAIKPSWEGRGADRSDMQSACVPPTVAARSGANRDGKQATTTTGNRGDNADRRISAMKKSSTTALAEHEKKTYFK